jgi:hypothetical protein
MFMKNDQRNLSDSQFTGTIVYGIVAFWFAFSLLMGSQGRYAVPNTPPIALGLSVLLPVVLFVAAYRRRSSFWAFCQTLDLRYVVAVHLWRVIAIDFLLCCAEGRLPAGFALPAGIGDILTGLAAVPLAFAISRATMPATRKQFVAWNIFGLLDLVLAVSLGIMHSGGPTGILTGSGPSTLLMSEFPRSLIPTFLVPLFMLLHLLALARRKEVTANMTVD